MFKKDLNRFKINFYIKPETPFLIKSGSTSDEPSRPDMEFVRTHHSKLGSTVYIPGSSLKGVFRSYSEKILRTLAPNLNLCNMEQNKECFDTKTITGPAYKHNCQICQLFGSSTLSSRVKFNDLIPDDIEANNCQAANKTEARANVSIDRITGGVANGPFFTETVTNGKFYGEIIFRNVTLWQIGMIIYVIEEMNRGYIPIGYAKSRGLGKVTANIQKVTYTSPKTTTTLQGDKIKISGVKELIASLTPDERDIYFQTGDNYSDAIQISKNKTVTTDRFLYNEITFTPDEELNNMFIKKLEEYIKEKCNER